MVPYCSCPHRLSRLACEQSARGVTCRVCSVYMDGNRAQMQCRYVVHYQQSHPQTTVSMSHTFTHNTEMGSTDEGTFTCTQTKLTI